MSTFFKKVVGFRGKAPDRIVKGNALNTGFLRAVALKLAVALKFSDTLARGNGSDFYINDFVG